VKRERREGPVRNRKKRLPNYRREAVRLRQRKASGTMRQKSTGRRSSFGANDGEGGGKEGPGKITAQGRKFDEGLGRRRGRRTGMDSSRKKLFGEGRSERGLDSIATKSSPRGESTPGCKTSRKKSGFHCIQEAGSLFSLRGKGSSVHEWPQEEKKERIRQRKKGKTSSLLLFTEGASQ